MAYDSKDGFNPIGDWNSFFENTKETICPVTECKLLIYDDCLTLLPNDSNLKLDSSQKALEVKLNVLSGQVTK